MWILRDADHLCLTFNIIDLRLILSGDKSLSVDENVKTKCLKQLSYTSEGNLFKY